MASGEPKWTESEDGPIVELTLNVLGYREEEHWVALALEMDLRGYGDTFAKACAELRDLVEAQISFAAFKGDPNLLIRHAEPVFFQLFADVRRERLQQLKQPAHGDYRVGSLPIPPAHVIAALNSGEWVGHTRSGS